MHISYNVMLEALKDVSCGFDLKYSRDNPLALQVTFKIETKFIPNLPFHKMELSSIKWKANKWKGLGKCDAPMPGSIQVTEKPEPRCYPQV